MTIDLQTFIRNWDARHNNQILPVSKSVEKDSSWEGFAISLRDVSHA